MWLGGSKTIMSTVAGVELVIRKTTSIPNSMKEYFHRFVTSFITKHSDGRIPIYSSLWAETPYEAAFIAPGSEPEYILPNAIRREIKANHTGVVNSEIGQELIKKEIDNTTYTIASIGSPVNIYVYDSYGNLIGMKEGEIKKEIPDAKFFIDEGNVQSIVLEDDKDYTFVVEAFDNGSFSFSADQRRSNKDVSIRYDKINITAETKASFKLISNSEDYIMDVDLDGDGVIDQKLEPDFVNIVDIPIEEEPNYVKSGTIETDYKKTI